MEEQYHLEDIWIKNDNKDMTDAAVIFQVTRDGKHYIVNIGETVFVELTYFEQMYIKIHYTNFRNNEIAKILIKCHEDILINKKITNLEIHKILYN